MPNNHLKRGTSPILYTQENQDGWFLEDLLEQAVKDLSAKEEFMLANYEPGPAMDNYLKSNKRISGLMQEAANLQKESIMFARENPLVKKSRCKAKKSETTRHNEIHQMEDDHRPENYAYVFGRASSSCSGSSSD